MRPPPSFPETPHRQFSTGFDLLEQARSKSGARFARVSDRRVLPKRSVELNPRELAMADEARSRLGRGLASLIGDIGGEAAHVDRPQRTQRKVPIEFLKVNPRNPRRTFPDSELGELAASIKRHGVIQPIVVRPVRGAQDRYEIIAGERRWRASQIAGLHDVPIVPVEVSDSDALEMAIIENVQREDLNAMEEALGYHALAD